MKTSYVTVREAAKTKKLSLKTKKAIETSLRKHWKRRARIEPEKTG